MFVSECLNLNEQGHLTIGGCDTVALAETYGTPLYVMDETTLRQNCRRYKAAMKQHYPGAGRPLYAGKSFLCLEVCRIIAEEGMGLDVVSGGELFTARYTGVPADQIVFHGNNKTPEELRFAVTGTHPGLPQERPKTTEITAYSDAERPRNSAASTTETTQPEGVGAIVVDHFGELELIQDIAHSAQKIQKIMLRIKPGIDAHTHDFVQTGRIDSKFGFALETGEALQAVHAALNFPNLELIGLHCHIGSQIFETDPFALAAEVMLELLNRIKQETGRELPVLNLGGGFGIQYLEKDDPKSPDEILRVISDTITRTCQNLGLSLPFLMIEPGRSLPGPAGITLYRVGAIKDIPGVRRFVSIDGGMGDNPRYILYQADYRVLNAGCAGDAPTEKVTIAGRYCESGDLIQEGTPLQPTKAGDVLAVLATGAYNYSMASNYNRVPRPPVILIGLDGTPREIIKRETVQDLLSRDL